MQIDLGTPLSELIGSPGAEGTFAADGLLGDVPPQAECRREADGFTLAYPGGPRLRFLGTGAR